MWMLTTRKIINGQYCVYIRVFIKSEKEKMSVFNLKSIKFYVKRFHSKSVVIDIEKKKTAIKAYAWKYILPEYDPLLISHIH